MYESWASGWDAVYKPTDTEKVLSCADRYLHAAATFRMSDLASAREVSTAGVLNMEAEGFAYFKASNPKFFFVAVSNCDPTCTCDKSSNPLCTPPSNSTYCTGPLILSYDITFTNGQSGELRHFGYDEIGILAMSWGFLGVYTVLVFAVTATVKKRLKAVNK